MKKFKFRLQTLLEIREAREEEIKNEMARLIAVQNREKTRQEELRQNIQAQQGKYSRKIRDGAYAPAEVIMFERYVDISLRAIDAAQQRIEAMQPQIEEVRGRLIQASKERKVVEKLRERQLREYDLAANRETAKENDDINTKIFMMQRHDAMEEV